MDELKENGYILFRNEIQQERVEYGKQQVNNKVNYFRLKKFLDNVMMEFQKYIHV